VVPGQVRAFVRRHPAVRHATRQIRIRLPLRLGGLDPALVPPRVRRFDLALPVPPGRAALPPLRISAPGDARVPRRLEADGLAGHCGGPLSVLLAALDAGRPGAVLDIGANIGVWSAVAAACAGRTAYAFEPAPRVAATARGIVRDNGLDVRVVELALSNHSGVGALHLSPVADTANTLAPGFRPGAGRVPVRVDTLAHWREGAAVVPAAAVVDTGDAVPEVVAGGLEVLRRFRPWLLCAVPPDRGVEERLMALLEPLDYCWYHLCGAPPHPLRAVIAGCRCRPACRMWLFTPDPVSAAVWAASAAWRAAIDACRPPPPG
jgi:FkbM family methyltransferase